MNKKTFYYTEIISKRDIYAKTCDFSLFMHPAWLKTLEEGLGYSPFGLLTRYGGIPVCISVFFECKKLGVMKLAGSPLPGSFTPYVEPIWLEDINQNEKFEILYNQHLFLIKCGYSYIERRFKEGSDALGHKSLLNSEVSCPETFVLTIEPDLDLMWMNMEGRSRNLIRKTEKMGVQLVQCQGTADDLELFYNMLKRVFAKSGKLPPHTMSLYRSIINNLIPEKMLLFLSAVHNEDTIAMGLFIHDREEIHFLSGASLEEAYRTGANNLIQWGVIKYAVENNLKYYDLGGKGIASIDKFKASFGGQTHSYGRFVWKTKGAHLAEGAYKIMNSVREMTKKV